MLPERELKPNGARVEIEGINPPLEAIEDVDNLYLWCQICAMTIATFGRNASPEAIKLEAQRHIPTNE